MPAPKKSEPAQAELSVEVDRTACRGSGVCVHRAPNTFALDADRKSRVAESPGDDADTIREAANACPFFAIRVR